MKQKTKLFVVLSSICLVLALGVFSVFSAEKFNFDMEGTIDFYGTDAIQTSFDFSTPNVAQATISEATLSGINKKDSGNMQSFGVSSGSADSSAQSWKNSILVFDENSTIPDQATISFTITNSSQTSGENIMVKLSSNAMDTSPIQAIPSADFCLTPGLSHTFTVNLFFEDIENVTSFNYIDLSVELDELNSSDIPSISSLQTQGFTFTTNSTTKTATFTQYSGSATSIAIPAVIKDASGNIYTVTATKGGSEPGESAFDSVKTKISSVTLPSTITTIGIYTFTGCTVLSDVVIPNGVIEIEYHAFMSCSGLSGELIIPKTVTSIGHYAFGACTGISGDLTIPNSVTMINDGAFNGCTGFDGHLTIGANITSINNGYSANFSGCNFETIEVASGNSTYYTKNNCVISKQDKVLALGCKNSVIPQDEEISQIAMNAFYGCKGLSGDLTIPNSVTSIAKYAFSGCTGLTGTLTIGSGVSTMGTDAFQGCNNLTTIVVDDGNENYYSLDNCLISNQNKELILGCKNSVIPQDEGILKIGEDAFYNCTSLTGILTIPSTVTTIGNYAFDGCTGISGALTIPNSVKTISSYAFRNCTELTSLTIGTGVTSIGSNAFDGCTGFTGALTIPNSVKTIGSYAFDGCMGLISLTIGTGVTTIDSSAFQNCTGFTGTLTIPTSVTSLGASVFYGCTGFTGTLTIPNNIKIINYSTFQNCIGLTGLIIGTGVTSIGSSAFNGCSNLTSIKINVTTPPTLNSGAFDDTGTCSIKVPSASVSTYKSASGWSTYASRIIAG